MWVAPCAELVSMFMRDRWRDQGGGGRLAEDLQAWAPSRGATQLNVTAYVANQGARRFYRRKGFVALSAELVLGM